MTHLVHVMDRLFGQPLFLLPTKAETIAGVILSRGVADLPLAVAAADDAAVPEASRFAGQRYNREETGLVGVADGVAIIHVIGSLVNRGAWVGASSGLVSYEGIAAQIDAAVEGAKRGTIKALAVDINSPGGEATGMFALTAKLRAARDVMPVIAVVNDMAASAAYGIAASADEVVISPTSIVGSVGVVFMHVDRSQAAAKAGVVETAIYAGANKTLGLGPLTTEARASIQSMVDTFYARFLETVELGRGDRTTAEAARATEANIYVGQAAIDAGLADRIGTFDQVLADLSNRPAARRANSMGFSMSTTTTNPAATLDAAAGLTEQQIAARVETARSEATAAATKAATTAERLRCQTILSAEAAKGRETMAAHLAFKTDMDAAAATALLEVSTKAEAPKPSGSRLDAAVRDHQVDTAQPEASGDIIGRGLGAAIDALIPKH